jgi:biotin synthase
VDPFSVVSYLYVKARENSLAQNDIEKVFSWPEADLPSLFAATDRLRRDYFGNKVAVCAIMNIKPGGCSEDCAFCAQSGHNPTGVVPQGMATAEQIAARQSAARNAGLDFCLVSTGRGLSEKQVARVARSARACSGPVHASLGIISGESFERLREAGVGCYNHNLETSRRYFPAIVSTHSYDERIRTVRAAQSAGMAVCCGGIFGIGETMQDRADLAHELKALGVGTIPLNFFIHQEGMRAAPPSLTAWECLRTIALFRLILPDRILKVAGGREVHLREMQPLMFLAGANGLISGGYLTTKGQGVDTDRRMLRDMGLEIMPEAPLQGLETSGHHLAGFERMRQIPPGDGERKALHGEDIGEQL